MLPLPYSSATPVTIPAGGLATSQVTIDDTFAIGDLDVKVYLRHPAVGELYLHLQAPDGTDVVLFDSSGGATANLTGTVFDDEVTRTLAQGQGPYTGAYRPASPLEWTASSWKFTNVLNGLEAMLRTHSGCRCSNRC